MTTSTSSEPKSTRPRSSDSALKRAPRGSVAVEPCGLLADAFNRADSAEALALAPGEQRQLVSDIVYRHG